MSAKNKNLIAKAQATVRSPKPERHADERKQKPGYRIVAVSLYSPEADWIDQITRGLQLAGNAKANRSLVVREAILRLRDAMQEKTPAEILTDFTAQQAKRAQGSL